MLNCHIPLFGDIYSFGRLRQPSDRWSTFLPLWTVSRPRSGAVTVAAYIYIYVRDDRAVRLTEREVKIGLTPPAPHRCACTVVSGLARAALLEHVLNDRLR